MRRVHVPLAACEVVSCASLLIDATRQGIERFSRGYEVFGFNRAERDGRAGILYREWIPAASNVFLIGEFSMYRERERERERESTSMTSVRRCPDVPVT